MSTSVDVHADPPATICVPFLLFSHTSDTTWIPCGASNLSCPHLGASVACTRRMCARFARTRVRYAISCRSQVALRVMMLSQSSLPRRRSSATLERQVDTSTVEVPFSRLLGQLGKEITLACACARPLWLRATPGGLRARNGTAGRDRLHWLGYRPLCGGRRAEAPSSREHLRRAERRWLCHRWGG